MRGKVILRSRLEPMYLLYSLVGAVGLILLLPYVLLEGRRRSKYLHHLAERLGAVPNGVRSPVTSGPGAIWIHAVSVGEVLAALPLAFRLKEKYPERRLVLSTTTATGQQLARQRAEFADAIFYFPLDWPLPVRRVFRAVDPAVVIIVETEIWPNFLRESRRAGVPVVFVNGRMSEKSFRRYQRWLRVFGFLLRPFLIDVLSHPERFLMQSELDARRLRVLGAPPERVLVAGNMKFDLAPPPSSVLVNWLQEELERTGRRPVVVAGSVTAGEEPLVLMAFGIVQGQWSKALLVLAPRKPERFDVAARLAEESHRKVLRRSQLELNGAPAARFRNGVEAGLDGGASVLVLDSVGELAGLYRLADAVFVGGSLVPAGGHNILEPAAFGKPPLFGPSMENFQEMAALFLAAEAGIQVASAEDLGVAWIELIQNASRRETMGAAARELVERNRGATERSVEAVAALVSAARGSR